MIKKIPVLFSFLILQCSLGLGTAAAASPELSVQRAGDRVRLMVGGDFGKAYSIETASVLGQWQLFLSWTQSSPVQEWLEPATSAKPFRFFRAVEGRTGDTVIPNFRLTDHLHRSHELYYQSTSRAVVLVFVDLNCELAKSVVASTQRLRAQFANNGVLFWVIEAAGKTDRQGLSLQAAALGISDVPVLHDRGGLVSRALGVTGGPEAWVIDSGDWSVVYRGSVEADPHNGGAGEYLAEALQKLVANQPLRFSRTPVSGCATQDVAEPIPDYATQIAPLLQKNCVECHSPGNIAPWSMTSYSSVQAYAGGIKNEILAGRMPPWHADPQFGLFANEGSLEPADAAALIRWIDAGAPRGNGADPLAKSSPRQEYPFSWPAELGEPDIILTVPRQSIRATGEEPYHYVSVPTGLNTDVWVRAAVILPGNVPVLHHCLVYFGSSSLLRGLDGFFAGYVPGSAATAYPPSTGKFLPKGTALQFQLHYTPIGRVETDQTRIGLYLHKEKPKFELQTRSAFSVFFNIPPRHPEFPATSQYRFDSDVWLYEMSPHMHYRGARFRFEALYPNGEREILLNVPKYDFDWQRAYRLAQPKRLPAGTTLICTGAWDNSPQNPHNPNPDVAVRFGEQSDDEMFIGYFNFAVAQ